LSRPWFGPFGQGSAWLRRILHTGSKSMHVSSIMGKHGRQRFNFFFKIFTRRKITLHTRFFSYLTYQVSAALQTGLCAHDVVALRDPQSDAAFVPMVPPIKKEPFPKCSAFIALAASVGVLLKACQMRLMDETVRSSVGGALKALGLRATVMTQKEVYDTVMDKAVHKMYDSLWNTCAVAAIRPSARKYLSVS
jgi:hypothetical protein